jgi:hypothetical protein
MAIIISKSGKNAKKIEKSDFEKESYIQEYLHKNPESIPLYEIKEDIRLLVLGREFPTESGPIDALGIDADGDIYCIETKLNKNPDKRLVVAQVLDYGASLWRSNQDFSEFTRWAEEAVHKASGVSLDQRLKDFFPDPEGDVNGLDVKALLESVKTNLNSGKFKFVILMDKLHEPLKNLIVFLNQNSRFDIFAVELEFYKHEDFEIMIPKLFGAEVKKDVQVAGPSRKWDETSFFEDAGKKLGEKEVAAIRKLFEFSKKVADHISWGRGITKASFSPKFNKISNKSLYTVRSTGILSPNFVWLNDLEKSPMYRDEFAKLLKEIHALNIPDDYQDKTPFIRAEKWCPVVDQFIEAVQKLLKM